MRNILQFSRSAAPALQLLNAKRAPITKDAIPEAPLTLSDDQRVPVDASSFNSAIPIIESTPVQENSHNRQDFLFVMGSLLGLGTAVPGVYLEKLRKKTLIEAFDGHAFADVEVPSLSRRLIKSFFYVNVPSVFFSGDVCPDYEVKDENREILNRKVSNKRIQAVNQLLDIYNIPLSDISRRLVIESDKIGKFTNYARIIKEIAHHNESKTLLEQLENLFCKFYERNHLALKSAKAEHNLALSFEIDAKQSIILALKKIISNPELKAAFKKGIDSYSRDISFEDSIISLAEDDLISIFKEIPANEAGSVLHAINALIHAMFTPQHQLAEATGNGFESECVDDFYLKSSKKHLLLEDLHESQNELIKILLELVDFKQSEESKKILLDRAQQCENKIVDLRKRFEAKACKAKRLDKIFISPDILERMERLINLAAELKLDVEKKDVLKDLVKEANFLVLKHEETFREYKKKKVGIDYSMPTLEAEKEALMKEYDTLLSKFQALIPSEDKLSSPSCSL